VHVEADSGAADPAGSRRVVIESLTRCCHGRLQYCLSDARRVLGLVWSTRRRVRHDGAELQMRVDGTFLSDVFDDFAVTELQDGCSAEEYFLA
jgi:hypothetical protein